MGEFESEIKRITAKRKAEIVMDIFQGKTTVAEASRKYEMYSKPYQVANDILEKRGKKWIQRQK